tara:strand:+ start:2429 stop:3046 length:618 start_codon:yes stop_codon:yes gene_type:complete
MDLFITSRKGILVQNDKVINNVKLFLPKAKFIKGDLTTPASIKNIHSISESILKMFIRPMGLNISEKEILELSKIDISRKYTNGECPPNRDKDNLTRGWSYLVSGVMHRFFHKNFDLYKVLCPLDNKMRDYHWWLESKCRNYVIDLTEEQYLKEGITNIRDMGQLTKSMGHLYGKKTKYMAYILATQYSKDVVNFKDINSISYIK